MLLTTATKSGFLAFLIVLLPVIASAEGAIVRLVTTVQAVSPLDLPSVGDVTAACGADIVCAAKILAKTIGPKAILEKTRHPTSDEIRLVKTVRSIKSHSVDADGVLSLELTRFGRKAVFEFKKINDRMRSEGKSVRRIILDLRQNSGGDVDRMLRVVSLFTGAVPDALHLHRRGDLKRLSVPETTPIFNKIPLNILVGPNTKSSAEVLALLLKQYADAFLFGERSFGKDYILRVVPVSHDWRLLVPAEKIVIPGQSLTGGIIPDGSWP